MEVFDRWGKHELVLPRQVTGEMEKGCQEIWGDLRLAVIHLMRVPSGLLPIFSSCHVQLLKCRCGVSELKRQVVIVKVIVLENEVLQVDQVP